MADQKKREKAKDWPFFVRQVGTGADSDERGGIKGHLARGDADTDATDRNTRSAEMGLKARYEVCEGTPD